jgi:hypothetical protein
MAYQIYTPMQAPTIPTSIFSSAAERGSKMGTLIDTPETARIKGEMLGKEKALAYEQAEANIELTNENIESANINQERQREALEADKRANKLAPIKEGIGIVGSIMDLYQGYQGIQENSLDIQLKQNKLELDNVKRDSQLKAKAIEVDNALLTAKNANADLTKAQETSAIQKQVSDLLSRNNAPGLLEVTKTQEFQAAAMDAPEWGAGIYSYLGQQGVISQAEVDERKGMYFAKIYAQSDLRLKSAAASKRRKDSEKAQEYFNVAMDALAGYLPEEKRHDPAYYSDLDVVSAGRYTVNDDRTKVDLSSKPDVTVSASEGSYLINRKTGEIISEIENQEGKEARKILRNHRLSFGAHSSEQQDTLKNGNLTLGPGGQPIRKTEQQSVEQPKYAGLTPGEKLDRYGVDSTRIEQSGRMAGKEAAQAPWYDVRQWGEAASATLNKVAPWAIDNISKSDMQDADKASRKAAKNTIDEYNKAGPKGKKAIVAKIAQITGGAGYSKTHIHASDTTEGRTLEGAFFKGEGQEDPEEMLTQVYKKEIVNAMEDTYEEGRSRGASKDSLEEAQNKRASAAVANEATPTRVAQGYARYTGKQIPGADKPTEVTEREVRTAVTSVGTARNWSDAKKADIETTANRVEENPYLKDQPPEVKAVAAVESAGDMDRVAWDTRGGKKDIIGLGQLGAAAAKDAMRFLGRIDLDRTKPEDNVTLIKGYLGWLASDPVLKGNKHLVYGAYNAGVGTIKDAIKLAGGSTNWDDIVKNLRSVLDAQYKAAVMRSGADNVEWTPQEKYWEIFNYPIKVLEYEQIFGQLT